MLRHGIIRKVQVPRHVDHVPVLAVLECELVMLEHRVPAALQVDDIRLARTQDLVLKGLEDLHVRGSGLLVVHLLHQASCARQIAVDAGHVDSLVVDSPLAVPVRASEWEYHVTMSMRDNNHG